LLSVTTVFCDIYLQVKDDTRRVEAVLKSTTTTFSTVLMIISIW